MKVYCKNIVGGLFLLLATNSIYAVGLSCFAPSGGYCNYSGKISRVYVNRSNLLLIYTDTSLDLSQLANAGGKFASVIRSNAIAVDMNKYPEFGKNIYSAALSAFMADRSIVLQCKDTYGAYLQTDRIWVGR